MKLLAKYTLIAGLLIGNANFAAAQKSIKEYVEKNDTDIIQKKIVVSAVPQSAGSYDDGHGSTPLLTSKTQLPDTVALITMYIYDLGTSKTSSIEGAYVTTVTTVYNFVSPKQGNVLANDIMANSIASLKESFRKQGVVLLTPDEYLNTPAKRDYYYNKFQPAVSKVGKFLSGIESKHTDIAVGADYYRAFDISAAGDYLRAESMIQDLGKKIGVESMLSIAVELQNMGKVINAHGVKMTLHGQNPVPKQDKNYIGQKMGTGYYAGQIYSSAYFFFDKPLAVAEYKKRELVSQNFEGIGVVMGAMIDKMYRGMYEAIGKAAKKYGKS